MTEGFSTIRAQVSALDGREALVEVQQGCGRCYEKGGCGGQSLTQMFCNGPKRYRVRNDVGAQVGDTVSVAVAPGNIRRSANLAYGLPVVACLAGAIVGDLWLGDVAAMLGGLLGLFAGFALMLQRSRGEAANAADQPYILSRMTDRSEETP
ncbi:SoxR reducing system RseC family protein [Azonexus sp. R2A61]|uniref:SoxR reducing system RseC family protein n=1 Tax=Azonexus sp. R2A61 TaxID=2744443 RepID=UPI001F16866A|nr:SoxR reducing system RseC family protein [Azonexus sp. R2A61]